MLYAGSLRLMVRNVRESETTKGGKMQLAVV